ncbi:MAG TPA: hypothetical protein VJ553_04315 [Candidatus Paceibacterota bacterium]|nr:hypothetical protein [Candidatus Paceibacterota bacterium]
MAEKGLTLVVDTPDPTFLALTLLDAEGTAIGTLEYPLEGYVDNVLLTAVDILLKKHSMDRFALDAVQAGGGIDRNSSLCRIVRSFASAVAATRAGGR